MCADLQQERFDRNPERYMAIIKNPALSMEASGNICGINYTSWRGYQIARCAWTGTVPNTTKQVDQQGLLTTVAQAWGGALTAEERETFNNSARSVTWRGRFGDPYIPNGYQLFMKLNIRRLVMGLVIMNRAPTVQPNHYVDQLQIVVQTELVRIVLRLSKTENVSHEGFGTEYYKAGPFDSGGRNPIEGEWRYIARTVGPSFFIDTDVLVGKWYWYRGREIMEFGDVANWFQGQAHNV